MEELLPLLAKLAPVVGDVLEGFSHAGTVLGALKDAATGVSELKLALAPASLAIGTVTDSIKSATGIVTNVFSGLASTVAPFVQALNPNLVFGLNQAFRSLQATIGVSLAPVVQVLTGSMRQVAGILLPVMQRLAPIMGTFAQTVLSLLIPPFTALADVLEFLTPLFELLAGVAQILVEGWKALSVIARALFQTFAEFVRSLFGGADVKEFLRGFRDAVHSVVEALLKLVAFIAKAINATGFIDKLSKNLRDLANPKQGAPPAPTDVGFKGFEDIAKTMAIASFAAQAGGADQDKSEREWLKKLAGDLEQVKNNGESIQTFLAKTVDDFQNWLARQWTILADSVGKAVKFWK